jgi:hypothetical protein
MLQDIDYMEASLVFYVKVHMFDQYEQQKICILTIISFRIVMPNVHHDFIVSMWFMSDSGDELRQASPDDLSIKQCAFYIYQT